MHRTTITESLLGTTVLFNTVFTMPKESGIFQILDWLLVFIILMVCIEAARDWEASVKRKIKRKKKVRRAGTQTDKENNISRL